MFELATSTDERWRSVLIVTVNYIVLASQTTKEDRRQEAILPEGGMYTKPRKQS
jgi:hypothetical protein